MGTWGVGPFDNDCAADIIAGLTKPLRIVETRKSNTSAQYHYNEARVAAQFLLLAHGTDILGGPELLQVVRVLARIRSDADWIADFKSPGTYMARLDQDLDEVLCRMQQCAGCKKSCKEAKRTVADARKLTMAHVESVAKQSRLVRVGRRKPQRHVGKRRKPPEVKHGQVQREVCRR